MIIQVFRGRYITQYIGLILFAFALWFDVLLFPEKTLEDEPAFTQWWLNDFALGFPLIATIISFLVLVFQAFLFNQVLEYHRITERNQLLVAAIYLLLMSSSGILVKPNQMLILNLLLITLINILFNLFEKPEAYSHAFDAGLIAGIASLIYSPMVYLLIFIWGTFIIYQIFTWREWFISIIGMLMPFVIAVTWFFVKGQLNEVAMKFFRQFAVIPEIGFKPDYYAMIIWGITTIIVFTGLGRVLKRSTEGTIEIRKKFRVLVFFFFISSASLVYSGSNFNLQMAQAVIPVTAFLSAHLSQSKKVFYHELLFALLLLAIFVAKMFKFE